MLSKKELFLSFDLDLINRMADILDDAGIKITIKPVNFSSIRRGPESTKTMYYLYVSGKDYEKAEHLIEKERRN